MDDKESTFGASVKGLHGLLGVGVGKDVPQDAASVDKAAGELLRARLEGTLPLDTAVVDALPAILGKLQGELLPLAGRPLGEVLLDADTELSAIKSIKDYGKKLAARRDSEADHSAAIAIYFAAIASALLFHGEKITSYGYEHLQGSFNELIEDTWIPAELSRHFSKACRMCRERRE
jgi:hypothetical protein